MALNKRVAESACNRHSSLYVLTDQSVKFKAERLTGSLQAQGRNARKGLPALLFFD
jgi:hypothetical protein